MFPECMMLMVWAVEMGVDLVFFLCLRRGIKLSDDDDDEEEGKKVVEPVAIKIEPESVKGNGEYDLMKGEDSSVEYY